MGSRLTDPLGLHKKSPDPAGIAKGSDEYNKKHPEAPKPPDPQATADAQTRSNVQTAIAEAQLNRVNEVTPYGGTTYTQTMGPNGVPIYTRTTTESDEERGLREGQQGLSQSLLDIGQTQAGQIRDALGQPYDPRRINIADTTGGRLDFNEALGEYNLDRFDPTNEGRFDLSRFDPSQALGDYGTQLEQQTYDLATSRLGREFDRAEEGLRTRLANQGITPGSEAWNAELESFNRSRGQAYTDAQLQARNVAESSRAARAGELAAGAGLAETERQTNMADLLAAANLSEAERERLSNELLTGRTQNVEEALRQYGIDTSADLSERQQPLSEIQAIIQGTPLTPINPGAIATSQIQPTNTADITQSNYQMLLNAYNQAQQNQASTQGAVAGVAGAALLAF